MKILFIAPLPPPFNGHSLVSRTLLDALVPVHDVEIVNLAKDSTLNLSASVRRSFQVVDILAAVAMKQGGAERIYLTISESLAGNIKDVFIYLLCLRHPDSVYIHLHGGSIRRLLWDRRPRLFGINRALLRRIGGVIISGEAHRSIFADVVAPRRIHILPNAVPDAMFVTDAEVRAKFSATRPLRLLYLSKMSADKGCTDLLDALASLPADVRSSIEVDFAGSFDSLKYRDYALGKIQSLGAHYHGTVGEDEKIHLFHRAHVFCLPTQMFEGQPISILEAYASGCAVITTGQMGIRDIFSPEVNGFEIAERSPESIASAIRSMVGTPERLLAVALANHKLAAALYNESTYKASFRRIIEGDRADANANVTGQA